MKKTDSSIINILSDAGLKAYQEFNADAYSASKAALILLTKCWALEYAKDKIRVNCICLG